MSEAALDRVMTNARVHLPGALDDAIKLELFNTLNEFLTDSRCWLSEFNVRVRAERDSYDIEPTEPGTIISLVSLVNSTTDVPVRATLQSPEVLVLASTPSEAATLVATVTLTVVDPVDVDDYPVIPTWLLAKYHLGILSGLLGRMMSQQAKPYSNERMAVFHTRKFRSQIAIARAEARHKNLYGANTWRFPQSFASGRQR